MEERIKGEKLTSINKKSANTNVGDTTNKILDGDVLFFVSMEDACIYTSSSSIDWILDSGSSHHITPCKSNFVSYEIGDYDREYI